MWPYNAILSTERCWCACRTTSENAELPQHFHSRSFDAGTVEKPNSIEVNEYKPQTLSLTLSFIHTAADVRCTSLIVHYWGPLYFLKYIQQNLNWKFKWKWGVKQNLNSLSKSYKESTSPVLHLDFTHSNTCTQCTTAHTALCLLALDTSWAVVVRGHEKTVLNLQHPPPPLHLSFRHTCNPTASSKFHLGSKKEKKKYSLERQSKTICKLLVQIGLYVMLKILMVINHPAVNKDI